MKTIRPRAPEVEARQPGHERPHRPPEGPAAVPGRDGLAVRAGRRVTEERADRLRGLRRQDVLELARLRLGRRVAQEQHVVEEPLGEPMAPDDLARAPLALLGEPHARAVELDEAARLQRPQVLGAERPGAWAAPGWARIALRLVRPPLPLRVDRLEDLLLPPRVDGAHVPVLLRSNRSSTFRSRPARPARSWGKL